MSSSRKLSQPAETANQQDSSTLLNIARQQLDIISQKRTGRVPEDLHIVDHALVAILMSAAAVEAEVNMQMASPVFCIPNLKLRKYFASLITDYLRMPIHTKIKYLTECLPGLTVDKETKQAIVALFVFRNGIVHSAPDYLEYPTRPHDLHGLDAEISAETMPIMSSFSTGIRKTEWLDQAAGHFKTAQCFIESLKAASKTAFSEFIASKHNVIQTPTRSSETEHG